MATVNTYLNCCPEAANVTVTQNSISLGAADVAFYHDYKTYSDVVDTAGVLTITLDNTPVSNDAVSMALNSGVQGEDSAGAQHNFTVAANVVTLHFVPNTDALFHFSFLGEV